MAYQVPSNYHSVDFLYDLGETKSGKYPFSEFKAVMADGSWMFWFSLRPLFDEVVDDGLPGLLPPFLSHSLDSGEGSERMLFLDTSQTASLGVDGPTL